MVETGSRQRIISIDILRGITVAGMILVNNPGNEEFVYAPLKHADWIGLTPTDLVAPFFMFIMGISICLSQKNNKQGQSEYRADRLGTDICRILKRSLMICGIGWGITLLFAICSGIEEPLRHMRITGVMPRLGICYGLAAMLSLKMPIRRIIYLIGIIFLGYFALLMHGNGFANDGTNIVAVTDRALLGARHLYSADIPDPEALLTVFPSLAHVLIGYCTGCMLVKEEEPDTRIRKLLILGLLLSAAGLLLSHICPVIKKVWTPTFSMLSCGICTVVLSLLMLIIDKWQYQGAWLSLFRGFGANPLAMFVTEDLLLLPFSILTFADGQSVQKFLFELFASNIDMKAASLAYALIYVMINWFIADWLYRHRIFIKL